MGASAVIDVAAGLVFRDGRLLIAQRRIEDHQGGLWEFPGGKRRSSESFQDCLRRELREELAVEVEVGVLLEDLTHAYPDRTVRLQFFRCVWIRHEPRPLGCQDFAWVTREGLRLYAFPPADQRLLWRLHEESDLWSGKR